MGLSAAATASMAVGRIIVARVSKQHGGERNTYPLPTKRVSAYMPQMQAKLEAFKVQNFLPATKST